MRSYIFEKLKRNTFAFYAETNLVYYLPHLTLSTSDLCLQEGLVGCIQVQKFPDLDFQGL